jgi:hypothetical protein
MKIELKFFVLIFLFLFDLSSYAKENICPVGQHWVIAHNRRAFYRAHGSFVKATNISAHCQNNPVGYTYWEPKFKDVRPSKWPNENEKTKRWNVFGRDWMGKYQWDRR